VTTESARQLLPVPGQEGDSWASAESYWMPEHVVESAWLGHGPFAFWVMAAVRPRVLAELGTHNGFSYFAFCEAAERLHLHTRTFAIDTWEGDDHAGFYTEDIYEMVSRVNAERQGHDSTLLRGYFDDFLESFDAGSIDLLHIDGRHGYDDAKHDFESWLPKLSEAGIVLFHDIAEHERGFGVWKLWAEVAATYPSFSFEHSHGLGMIAVGPDVPRALQPLFQADAAETTRIRDFYSGRGERVVAAYSLLLEREQLRIALVESDRQLQAGRHELNGLRNSVAWKSSAPLRWVIGRIPPGTRLRMRGMRQ
jgi:hypothetical protein